MSLARAAKPRQYLAGRRRIRDFSVEMMRLFAGALRQFAPLAMAVSIVLSAPLDAQSLSVGRLGGVVVDAAGKPLHDVEVRVIDRAGGAERAVTSARDGSFRFEALPDGRYDLLAEALGYVPVRHLDVRVGAGVARFIEVRLAVAPPPVTRIDTLPRRGDVGSLGQWMLERGYADLVGARRVGSDVAGFSPGADINGVEGLPWRLTGSLVDGARFNAPMAQAGNGADAAGLSLPVRGVATASVGGLGYDAEVGGTGVGLRATTLRGGGRAQVRGGVEGGTASLGAAYQFAGSLQGDTAQAVVGVDYQRFERDFWNEAVTVDPRLDERVGLYGRLDWQGSDRLAISARASGGRYTSVGRSEEFGLSGLFGPSYEATAGQASVNVLGRITKRLSHEWRIAADVGQVQGGADATRGLDATSLASTGSALGTAFRELRATPRASGLLHVDAGVHRLKAGFATAAHRLESDYVRDASGLYAVGGPATLTVDGAWRQVVADDAGANLRLRETALFVQDDWQVVDGLALTLGLRFDRFTIPAGGISRNAEWFALSGLDNAAVEARSSGVSPRVGFRWELGANADWVIEGGAGTFRDLPDLRDLGEALTMDRGADVRLGTGTLPITSPPDFAEAPVVGRTLTMLAPDFAGSRTNRLSLGLTRRAGAWSASLSGVYRMTDGLSRRRDLNLPAFAAGVDQDGRSLYGQLEQFGATLQAVPQSNRRFSAFDAAYALEASGFSEYYGATFGVERVSERGLSFTALYTFSRTVDNFPLLGGTTISPFPLGLAGADWAEGTSDLDVPHRAMLAMEYRPNALVSVGAVYRLRSGLPFTPGFRDGVDANGDGDWRNDVAFVNATLPGMDALLSSNGCLKSGAVAERNSCRGELVHGVDLRAEIQLARLTIGRLALVVDAIDVLAANNAPLDRALLLVDPLGAVSVNPVTGVTTLPFVVNPAFGETVTGRSPGVFWRVGLRVTP